jgi:GTP-binding protein HflX
MHENIQTIKPQAVLVSVYKGTPNLKVCQDHLDELELLAETAGIDAIIKIPCPIRTMNVATYLQKGKIEEIKSIIQEKKANILIFDEEISPAQQRNLEKAFGVRVMDRTELILEVFGQRAQTREARLQIDLAKTKYQLPRLKNLWGHLSRQRGGGSGGVFLKGEGEKQIELDRRMVKEQIEKLQAQLHEVRLHRETQRAGRAKSAIPIFAIVGYTNAGKSTLLNALTAADVFVEDKLFATLDTTTRKFTLPNNQDILLIDTVGFIRKLPHTLVAAFKGTLEEALYADFLLHLIDVSNPLAEEQAETTLQVLKELNAHDKPIITLLNKIDKPGTASMASKLRIKYPHTVQLSALKREGFEELEELMLEEINKRRQHVALRIPQKDYHIINEILTQGKILKQEYEENDILVTADLPSNALVKLKKYLVETT